MAVGSTSRIVVGILSCQKTVDRKREVEATWLRDLPSEHVTPYFLVGRPGRPAEIIGDTLYLDCPDTYLGLPEKVVAFLEYAQANLAFDHVFKCDDDTWPDGSEDIPIPSILKAFGIEVQVVPNLGQRQGALDHWGGLQVRGVSGRSRGRPDNNTVCKPVHFDTSQLTDCTEQYLDQVDQRQRRLDQKRTIRNPMTRLVA